MTKTPEELTEDWKAGKLDWNKFYYIKLTSGEICIDYAHGAYFIKGKPQEITMDYTTDNDVKQILAPVPDYEEFESLRKTANGVKYVSDKCWEKTKALEGNVTMFKSLFRQYLEREKEFESLRALLKQCIPAAEFAKDKGLADMINKALSVTQTAVDNTQTSLFVDDNIRRIKQALNGESEE